MTETANRARLWPQAGLLHSLGPESQGLQILPGRKSYPFIPGAGLFIAEGHTRERGRLTALGARSPANVAHGTVPGSQELCKPTGQGHCSVALTAATPGPAPAESSLHWASQGWQPQPAGPPGPHRGLKAEQGSGGPDPRHQPFYYFKQLLLFKKLGFYGHMASTAQ